MRAGDTPLIDAARHGRAGDVAALLADGADVNEPRTDGSGWTALLIACKGELSAGIRALVDAERWAVSPEAAGDDTSLPDLVRLQTHNHALLD